jgi:N-acylglucosamine-6-phosphate 2-epimerase
MIEASVWESLHGGLIVSCQAADGDPLRNPAIMAALALAAVQGGAVGIRANGAEDIAAIRNATERPIIGLQKRVYSAIQCITPTFADAQCLAAAGASILAVEATQQREEMAGHERIDHFASLLHSIHAELHRPVLADISTLEEGLEAARLGADAVATTLSGYTPQSPTRPEPDFDLLRALLRVLAIPVLAEGHIWTPEHAARARTLGAYAVIVGSAITRPRLITARFAAAVGQPNL